MGIAEWAAVVSAIATVGGAIAASWVAFIAYRYSRDADRRRERGTLKHIHAESNERIDAWFEEQTPYKTSAIDRATRRVIDNLNNFGADTSKVKALAGILDGHSWWVQQAADPDYWWIQALDQDALPDEENIAGIMNGVLDVVKDSVLLSGNDGNDWDYLQDSFFVELAAPEFMKIADRSTIYIQGEREEILKRCEKRFIKPEADAEVRTRISALIWYKIVMEQHLAAFFMVTFTNDGSQTVPTSRKFKRAIRSAWNSIREEYNRLVSQKIDA